MKIKHILGGLNWGVIILVLFGGMMVFQAFPDALISLKPAVSFEDMLDGAEVKVGSHVSGEVPYVLDYFATESTYTRYSDGSRTGDKASGKYYLVPTEDAFIAMKGRQSDVGTIDQLIDETWEFMETGVEPKTEFSMEGKVEVLEEQLAGYYRDYMKDLGFTEDMLDELGDPLVVQNVSFTACWVLSAIGVVLVALGVLVFMKGYRRAKYGSGLAKAEDLPDVPVHTTARPFDGADD